jgi:hypothetical protein
MILHSLNPGRKELFYFKTFKTIIEDGVTKGGLEVQPEFAAKTTIPQNTITGNT